MTENASAERGPHGWLQLTVQQPLPGWRVSPPRVLIEGRTGASTFGPNTILLPPGTHQVQVTPPFRLIKVECQVDVREGQVSELWYSLPLARGHVGSIGPLPQPNHAARYLLLVGAFIVVGLIVTVLR
jgi:hypothetical protein